MFHSAAVKLTFWYLSIVMVLSIGCSIALYNVSSGDLQQNSRKQVGYFRGLFGPENAKEFSELRQNQLEEDLNHLRINLLLFNLLVLVGGGAVSYALARRTLGPIEQALESQTRFTSDASHELRTPLTAIQTENEVTLRNPSLTKTEAIEQLKSNLEEVERLKSLSEGLLALASTEKDDESSDSIKVSEIVSDANRRVAKVAEIKKIKIIPSQIDKKLVVKGNRQNLVDLLVILLDNAIKYSSDGQAIKIVAVQHNKKSLISVIDKGQGIDSGDLPRIFDRFYRADSSRSKINAEGYGLGLAIAKKIADRHNGSIDVKTAPGKGATFTVKIPL